jgi:hypothetical protein
MTVLYALGWEPNSPPGLRRASLPRRDPAPLLNSSFLDHDPNFNTPQPTCDGPDTADTEIPQGYIPDPVPP